MKKYVNPSAISEMFKGILMLIKKVDDKEIMIARCLNCNKDCGEYDNSPLSVPLTYSSISKEVTYIIQGDQK